MVLCIYHTRKYLYFISKLRSNTSCFQTFVISTWLWLWEDELIWFATKSHTWKRNYFQQQRRSPISEYKVYIVSWLHFIFYFYHQIPVIIKRSVENSVARDQFASQKPADLELNRFIELGIFLCNSIFLFYIFVQCKPFSVEWYQLCRQHVNNLLLLFV